MTRGQIVRAIKGRDKGSFLVVLQSDSTFVTLCDGKGRPLERPKRKKLFHTAATAIVLPEEKLTTNRQIRTALRVYNEGAET